MRRRCRVFRVLSAGMAWRAVDCYQAAVGAEYKFERRTSVPACASRGSMNIVDGLQSDVVGVAQASSCYPRSHRRKICNDSMCAVKPTDTRDRKLLDSATPEQAAAQIPRRATPAPARAYILGCAGKNRACLETLLSGLERAGQLLRRPTPRAADDSGFPGQSSSTGSRVCSLRW